MRATRLSHKFDFQVKSLNITTSRRNMIILHNIRQYRDGMVCGRFGRVTNCRIRNNNDRFVIYCCRGVWEQTLYTCHILESKLPESPFTDMFKVMCQLIEVLSCIWGLWYQEQVCQIGICNCIQQNTVGCHYLSLHGAPGLGTKVHIYAPGNCIIAGSRNGLLTLNPIHKPV